MPQDRARHPLRDASIVAALTLLLLFVLEAGARRLARPEPAPKAEGAYRVLALGGSTVAGVPESAYGFVAQLRHALLRLAPGRRIEMLNLARPGADSAVVRRSLEAWIDADPDLVIVLMGHNEFLDRPRRTALGRSLRRLRDASALARLATDTAERFGISRTPAEPGASPIEPVARTGPEFDATRAAFRDNLGAIVSLARDRGVSLILCTAPSNVADWPPVPAASDPGDAHALYREGQALRRRGRGADARERLKRAKELDPYPLRALDVFNDAVRALDGTPGVRVVDVERLFEEHSADGLVGFELVCDNCHPTPLGHALVARAILAAMAQEGPLVDAAADLGDAEAWVARLEHRLGADAARVRARWLLSNGVYSMKAPFRNFAAARDYLDRAARAAPDEWRVWANLATLALLEGDLERGRSGLRRAQALKGAPLDPEDRGSLPALREALARSGIRLPDPARAGGS